MCQTANEKKERSWGTKDTHISSPIPPIIGERGGLGGEAEKSQRVHRDVVVLDGREVRDPCLPPTVYASHVSIPSPQCPVPLVRWGVCTKHEHTWCRGLGDGGMGDGGCDISFRRPEVGSMAKRVGDLLGMGGI